MKKKKIKEKITTTNRSQSSYAITINSNMSWTENMTTIIYELDKFEKHAVPPYNWKKQNFMEKNSYLVSSTYSFQHLIRFSDESFQPKGFNLFLYWIEMTLQFFYLLDIEIETIIWIFASCVMCFLEKWFCFQVKCVALFSTI